MNVIRKTLIAVVLAGSALNAVAADSGARVVIDCSSNRAPKMSDVARVVGTDNFWQTYAARERLISLAKSRCKRGADFVQFIPGTEDSTRQGLAVAESRFP
jgi:hypothetical protein